MQHLSVSQVTYLFDFAWDDFSSWRNFVPPNATGFPFLNSFNFSLSLSLHLFLFIYLASLSCSTEDL